MSKLAHIVYAYGMAMAPLLVHNWATPEDQ